MKKFPRSPYRKVDGLVYFGRMIDKIRLTDAGKLSGYNLGTKDWYFFDARCCRFLGIKYKDVVKRVRKGASDKKLLKWCRKHGTRRSKEEIEIWNTFMCKRGWNDLASGGLAEEKAEAGLSGDTSINSFFDLFDREEGRVKKGR